MKFEIYIDGKRAENFDYTGAYVFGSDRTPLRASESLTFKDSLLQLESDTLDSAGICLLWEVKGFGKFMLPTTKLRYREEPYNLNLELARSRIMQITIKREDWAFFSDTNSFGKKLQELQSLFIEAVNAISEPEKCSLLADKCLYEAMVLSDLFARKYAESYLSARQKKGVFGKQTLGCTLQADKLSDKSYIKNFFDTFGYVSVPSSWREIESNKGEYDFSKLDKFFKTLESRNVTVNFGPLLCFSKVNLPDWLIEEKAPFPKIQEYAYNYVFAVVKRYAKRVNYWRVIAGMNACNIFGFNFEQILEMTRTATIAAKAADAKCKKIIEVMYPWGEYYAKNQKTIPPLVYVDMISQSGINFEVLGLQLNFGKGLTGMYLRDMMQISSRLDCFAAISKPLHLTSITAPSKSTGNVGGYYAEGWNQSQQAKWLENIVKVALGKPFITNIVYSAFSDTKDMSVPNSALCNEAGDSKQAYKTIVKLQQFLLKK